MFLEKSKLKQIIREHKIASFKEKDEDELVNIFYEAFTEAGNLQQEKLATKDDIKMLIEMMNKRFEAVDKRFEAVDKRFEAVDRRFEDMYKYMDKRFEAVDKRFEAVDKRFEEMNKRLSRVLALMNLGFGILILLTVLFKFLN
jgi:flagellar capping protein FliD